jgi:hypothetical protein
MDIATNTDSLSRRSRWGRQGNKPAQLIERDLDIFRLLQRYRYLPADYIHAFVGGNKTRFQERLNKLYREPNCYLDRPGQQRQTFDANYRSLIYENDNKAQRALQDFGYFDPEEAVAWLSQGRERHVTFAHSVMICEALASIELGLKDHPELRLVPWREIHAKMPEKTRNSKLSHCLPVRIEHTIGGKAHHSDKALMPDAVFGIEWTGKGTRYFALECDRDHEPLLRSNLEQTSYLRKILQYQAAIEGRVYKTHWGLPNLMALHVTNSDYHMNKIKELVGELYREHPRGMPTYQLLKTMPSLGDFAKPEPPTGRLFKEGWQRVGHPDFVLNQP